MRLNKKLRGVLHVFKDELFPGFFCNFGKETYFYFKRKSRFLICSHDS